MTLAQRVGTTFLTYVHDEHFRRTTNTPKFTIFPGVRMMDHTFTDHTFITSGRRQRRDKEAVRPMYREFRELEAKIASVSAASAAVPAEADSLAGTPTGDPTPGDENSAIAGAGESDGIVDLPDIKKERDAKKRDIKEWIKEFEEREGHPPSTK